jgi:hypothetical protein
MWTELEPRASNKVLPVIVEPFDRSTPAVVGAGTTSPMTMPPLVVLLPAATHDGFKAQDTACSDPTPLGTTGETCPTFEHRDLAYRSPG